jgi:molybdopterin-guanine dinucleotide biosynthesis protein A
MDAIVIAGGTPQPGEYLYEETNGSPKAMLDIAGKPMIQWVLDALGGAKTIDQVVVIGLPAESCDVRCHKPLSFFPNQADMIENIRTGAMKVLELNPQADHFLIASSDIPAITSEMVDWEVQTAMETDDDAYYHVITREIMEARFPGSRRSYVHLKGMDVCGGDMNIVRAQTVTANEALWKKIVDSRKNAIKQASLLGYDTLFLLMFRLLTLEKAVALASKRLSLKGRAIVCPYAEVGMDVDKPHQLAIMRADLAKRAKS